MPILLMLNHQPGNHSQGIGAFEIIDLDYFVFWFLAFHRLTFIHVNFMLRYDYYERY